MVTDKLVINATMLVDLNHHQLFHCLLTNEKLKEGFIKCELSVSEV